MEGVNSTMIYCKNLIECHNVPSEQQEKIKLHWKKNRIATPEL
jgi:hypothetical protein